MNTETFSDYLESIIRDGYSGHAPEDRTLNPATRQPYGTAGDIYLSLDQIPDRRGFYVLPHSFWDFIVLGRYNPATDSHSSDEDATAPRGLRAFAGFGPEHFDKDDQARAYLRGTAPPHIRHYVGFIGDSVGHLYEYSDETAILVPHTRGSSTPKALLDISEHIEGAVDY